MSESEMKVMEEVYEMVAEATMVEIKRLEERIIALERGLEAVLRRLEQSGQPEDEAGWFGRPE